MAVTNCFEELRPDRRVRFEHEARAAAALSHPDIVARYDIGEQDGGLYIASELVAGETLRAVMRSGPLPARQDGDRGNLSPSHHRQTAREFPTSFAVTAARTVRTLITPSGGHNRRTNVE